MESEGSERFVLHVGRDKMGKASDYFIQACFIGWGFLVLLGANVTLLNDGEADTLILGERDERLVFVTQNEDVRGQSGPDLTTRVADLDDLLSSGVGFPGEDDTDATDVVATGGHAEVSDVEFDESNDFAGGEVDLDDVVLTDVRVGVADGATIVGADERDSARKQTDLLDTAELERSLLGEDSVEHKAALGIVQETEVLISATNLNNVHEASGESGISAHLRVDRDQTLHQDQGHLTTGQGILESVAEEDHQGQALTELVGTSTGTRSLSSFIAVVTFFFGIVSHSSFTPHFIHTLFTFYPPYQHKKGS